MSSQHNKPKWTGPDESLRSFLSFVSDPLHMEEDELDELLSEAGIDFPAFDVRLKKDIERAKGRASLSQANESRRAFKDQVQRRVSSFAMSLEEKRREIQQRLGLLGEGQSVAIFNRNFNVDDEDDLDDLLDSLRSLDERFDVNDEGP